MTRISVQLPNPLKAKLDALRAEGITASGLIRRLLTQYFTMSKTTGRKAGKP